MINILIPMAGKGSRFAEAGYADPKPLINVAGAPMIIRVVRNLKPLSPHRFIFVCQKEHLKRYLLENQLRKEEPDCVIVTIDRITEGAACTALLAKDFIDNDNPLMIANSDQYVDIDINEYLSRLKAYDGLIMTMPANDPKWSFIRYDGNKRVTLVREKEVISDQATVGIYNFAKGHDFVAGAEAMIKKNLRVNNEFYVAPVYNELIQAGKSVTYFDIGERMHGLGTPKDLDLFLAKFPKTRLK